MDTKALRQKILDLAIRGRLVPQDPNDEPASVLLQRIREEKERLIKEGKIKKGKKSAKTSDTGHYVNVPFEVPGAWEWCNIKDVTNKITDGTHNSPINTPQGDYKYITAKNIKASGIVLDSITYVSKDIHDEIYSRCNPEKGDILYIKDGATTGIATINNLDEPFSLLSSVALIKPIKEVSNIFLLYYLQSSLCYNSVRETMKGVGITRVTLKQIEQWDIPLPPLAEQRRIVAEIERWFSLIDIIESGKASLQTAVKQAKSKILDLAIHGKLVPQDPDDEPASELLRRINPKAETASDNARYGNVPFEVPGSWAWTTLGEISDYGKSVNVAVNDIGDKEWVLELEDIEKDTANIIQRFYKSERAINGVRHKFRKGDVLYSKLRTYLNKALVASDEGYCTTEIMAFSTYGGLSNDYICHVLRSQYFLDYTLQCGYGVKMPRLSTTDACKGLVPLPPLAEQHRIVSKIEELFAQLDRIEAAL